MVHYTEYDLSIPSFEDLKLKATFYKPNEAKTVILYFHGGGFIFGYRNDLQEPYIEHLSSLGIGIVTVDYPLAPEVKLKNIIHTTQAITKWFSNSFLFEQKINHYFIMGRSAGAFLALKNSLYAEKLTNQPLGTISFYGYFNLNDASFAVPSRHYLKYKKIVAPLIETHNQHSASSEQVSHNRYLQYLQARQKGNWLDLMLNSPLEKKELSIEKEQLKLLPSLFITAATHDPDVPSQQSRQLANIHEESTIHLVDNNEHDFDRTSINTLGIEVYEKLGQWILNLIH